MPQDVWAVGTSHSDVVFQEPTDAGPSRRTLLLELARDLASWRAFVCRHCPTRLRMSIDPEDILQQAYLCAYTSQSRLYGTTREETRGWFSAVILNTIRNLDRLHGRIKRRRPAPCPFAEERITKCERSVDDSLATREVACQILELLGDLPPKQSLLIIYVYLDGMKLADAAAKLELPAALASHLLYQGRRKIRQHMLEPRNARVVLC